MPGILYVETAQRGKPQEAVKQNIEDRSFCSITTLHKEMTNDYSSHEAGIMPKAGMGHVTSITLYPI